MPEAPKVFLSHASEDKERFVIPFATALRAKGIDVWLDRWEMVPGDSLIDRIFEEGLKQAAAVIIVLSHVSTKKPWVREELNAATVARISKGTKLIPVVIDDCEVPEALKATVWERVPDLEKIDAAVDRIVASILNLRTKPAIGKPPSYATLAAQPVPGLSQTDLFVLLRSCEWLIDRKAQFIDPNALFLSPGPNAVPLDVLKESLEILDQQHHIKLFRVLGPAPYRYSVTSRGLETYLRSSRSGYAEDCNRIAHLLVNGEADDNYLIAERLGIELPVVDHVLESLERKNHVSMSKMIGGHICVFAVHPSLKRELQ